MHLVLMRPDVLGGLVLSQGIGLLFSEEKGRGEWGKKDGRVELGGRKEEGLRSRCKMNE